jgi:hypothetical protein
MSCIGLKNRGRVVVGFALGDEADPETCRLRGAVIAQCSLLSPVPPMPSTLSERDWTVLLQKIQNQRCTPFLGAGACFGSLPLGSEIAREWSRKYEYPFGDDSDLVRVAQYVAVQYDPVFPKIELLKQFQKVTPPNSQEADEPHGLLADMPLPVYMTTNYDNFMVQALKSRYRDPKREMCRWNDLIHDEPSAFDRQPAFEPTVANPVVFHLHGHTRPESLVLTEDDYLEFLGRIAENPDLLPARVRAALANSSCLFIGYRMADWNFRVIFQGLRRAMKQQLSFVVMPPPPGDSEAARRKAQDYLDRYYAALQMVIYWGTAREFCAELRRRWAASAKAP